MVFEEGVSKLTLSLKHPETQKIRNKIFDFTTPFGCYLLNITKECMTTYTTSTSSSITLDSSNYSNVAYTTSTGPVYYDYHSAVQNTINKAVEEALNEKNKKGKEKPMDLFKNFSFGSCENDNVKVSMYGVAVKNANGSYVSYDNTTNSVIDVDILNFDAKYLYKMPVAIKDIAVGDTIIHNKVPMFVTKVEETRLVVVDPKAGEEKIILPTKSMFGFDFVTKIINLFGNFMNTASADNPFGNMLPMLLASENSDPTILLLAASGGKEFDMTNPMLLYAMAKNSGADMLPLFLLMNQIKK